MTRWRFPIIILVLIAAMAAGCSSDAKKPTEDSLIAMEALNMVEGLRVAFQMRDFSSMARYCTRDAYKGITEGLKSFDTAELVFTPKWVEINRDGDAVEMLVAWKGTWKTGEETTEKDGTVLFSIGGDPLKVRKIARFSPFGQP